MNQETVGQPHALRHPLWRHLVTGMLVAVPLLSGCAPKITSQVTPAESRVSQPVTREETAEGEEHAEKSDVQDSSRLAQCTRELNALKEFDTDKYNRYKSELEHLTASGARYLAVSGNISKDINDLVQPRYQYALTSLCQRIKADLSSALINQVKIQ
ncbi:TPA: hypothetical protein U2R15_004062 [Klebsiella aerogenes]|nr:hypothetical protein [Klebsiella aerogenes]